MPPPPRLHDAFLGRNGSTASSITSTGGQENDKVICTYRWNEFGKEITTDFRASHFELDGSFESNSSQGHKDFQDRMQAIHLRRQGKQKAEIARVLDRSEQFVAKWWQKEEKEVPRPWGVHDYLAKDMAQRTSSTTHLVGSTADADMSTATWWRDVEVKRKYFQDPAIYDELVKNADWKPSVARTRDFGTGAMYLKYDKTGKTKQQGNQGAKYAKGTSPAFEKCLQKLFAEYGIADRTSGILLNWYPDGDSTLGTHRHDCWTALFSFGSERILTIDKTPLLCQDGDLVIFGTQRHGVPHMAEISEGRITVPIFFYPDHMQAKRQWQTLTDPEDPRASRALLGLEREASLGGDSDDKVLWSDPARAQALGALMALGFDTGAAQAALRARAFNVDDAAEALLMAGMTRSGDGCDICGDGRGLTSDGFVSAQEASASSSVARPAPRGRWGRGSFDHPLEDVASFAAGGVEKFPGGSTFHATAVDCVGVNDGAIDDSARCASVDDDAALALKLQADEMVSDVPFNAFAEVGATDDANFALAAHFEEEQQLTVGSAAMDAELREAQFRAYDELLDREDAEKWHGHGDLMMGGLARNTLTLESMDKTTCYSIGHGRLLEKTFFELLSLHSVRALYDLRASDHRGDVHAPCQQYTVRALRSACKVRGITYKHVALGRESAYGMLAHMSSDEAHHALIEVAWHAKRHHTAFLGFDEDWRADHRQVVAEELAKLGHIVKHIDTSGGIEEHVPGKPFPDFLLREEEKLRKLEKMRQAGELKRPEKSSVDRSTESVASRLDRPPDVVDAMDEMRSAMNQTELVQIQRKLARIQRVADKNSDLASKKLANTPHWLLEEAREQEAWIAQKKAEKLQSAAGTATTAPGPAKVPGPPSEVDTGNELLVECAGCAQSFAWVFLVQGDGRCRTCAAVAAQTAPSAGSGATCSATEGVLDSVPEGVVDDDTNELLAECSGCATLTPWKVLAFGDGACPACCSACGIFGGADMKLESLSDAMSSSDVAAPHPPASDAALSTVAARASAAMSPRLRAQSSATDAAAMSANSQQWATVRDGRSVTQRSGWRRSRHRDVAAACAVGS